MKKIFYILAACIAVSPGIALAEIKTCCRELPQWYMGLSGQAVFLDDADIKHSNPAYTSDLLIFDPGYGLSGQIGYRLFPKIRTELEFVYRTNEIGEAPGSAIIGSGKAEQTSIAAMLNAYYDFANQTRLTPYIGAGVGVAQVSNDRFYIDGITGERTDTLEAFTLAYQLMAGVSYEIDSGMSTPIEFVLGYRYFTGADVEDESTLSSFPSDLSFPNDSHNAELGVRMFF
jgi:opacity protein-like surface antigen